MSDNMYDHLHHTPITPFCSYSESTDDFSVFLRQILLKSSSPSFVTPKQEQPHPSFHGGADAVGVPVNAVASSSSCVGGTVGYYEHQDYDCESEEGLENLMEEMIAKPNPGRNATKRTRPAEVHNMSEKRRRSRINEKLKALQKLIPNSNKSDKASMLDEAIEYLKQLQLQVQALTMRNGINWYTMSASHGVPQPNQNHRTSGIYHGIQSMNMTANQERPVNPMLTQNQPSILDFSRTINQGPCFGTQFGSP